MNIILLSGGSGKRLWPLSNDIRSKQFIKLFKDENDNYVSMVQRVYHQIRRVDENAVVTIATSQEQVSAIHNQLGNDFNISIEPERRDTFPAIVLATAYLTDVLGVDSNEPIIVCPVDPFVDDSFFESFNILEEQVKKDEANIVLLGIEPCCPSEKYGYMIPADKCEISKVLSFKEKPSEEIAKEYINQGGLWNGGVFAYRASYVLEKARQVIDYKDYHDLYSKYDTLDKISFDYAVVEKESNIKVVRYSGEWKDLGTWNTLTEAMEESVYGSGLMNESCENLHIINEMDVPILAMGISDSVIAASPNGILVCDKEQSSYIKPFVDSLDQRVMFTEKSWGDFRIIDVEPESLTIKVTIKAGNKMSYHSHKYRDEVWTVVSGTGKTIVDGMEQIINPGDVITMQAGCRHTVIAISELRLIEVQLGKEISIHDKQIFPIEK